MQNKSIKEISLEELDQIIGAGKNGVFKTISHEYRMNSFQFYSLVVLNVMSLVILDVATKRGKPLFLESERTTRNFRTIKNIIRHYIVISVPCVIILKETSGKA